MEPPACPSVFEWTLRGSGWTLVCGELAPWHGWTTRGLDPEGEAGPDWARIAAESGVDDGQIVRPRQVHGSDVIIANRSARETGPCGDAVIARDPGMLATVCVADCVPILVADRARGAVAAIHAGWRGTSAGIAGRAIAAMSDAFGSRGADLVAALGPSIGPCCYQTGPAVREGLRLAGWPSEVIEGWLTGPERRHFDLWRANADQLVRAGLASGAVFVAGLCTACHAAWFHSYRRDGDRAGRMAAYIRPAEAPREAGRARRQPRPSPRWQGDRRRR